MKRESELMGFLKDLGWIMGPVFVLFVALIIFCFGGLIVSIWRTYV